MGFLNQGGTPTIFLEIGDVSKKKLVRPLAKEPICIWGHNIQSVEVAVQVDAKVERVRLRDYHYEPCVAVDRRGTGCTPCNSVDPGWQYLDPKNQTNKKGQRVDFSKKPVYLLPVWSYSDQAIRVLRGGNQIYEAMDQWDSQGRNIMDCDWMLWKEQIGQSREQIKYKSDRQDSSSFTVQITGEQIKEAMNEAAKNYLPLPTDKLYEKMKLLPVEEATKRFLEAKARSNPALAGAPTQAALPPASPFTVPTTQGAMPPPPLPALPPAVQFQPPAVQFQPPAAAVSVPLTTINNGPIPPQPGASTVAPVVQVPTTPPPPIVTVDDTPPPGVPPALWAILTPEQKAAMKPASPGVTPSGPLAQAAVAPTSAPAFVTGMSVGPTVPVQTNPQVTTPIPSSSMAVPVTSSPVPLPQVAGMSATAGTPAPVQASPAANPDVNIVTNPGDVIIPSGKNEGKKLSEVDTQFLKFYRSTQKNNPALIAAIDQVLNNKPAMPAPVPTTPSQPAPTVQTPVVIQATPTAVAVAPATDERANLVKEIRVLINSIPEFQGAGMGSNLVPFLRNNFGKFDYTNWELPMLQKLKAALLEKTGGQIPANIQVVNP